MSGKGVYSGWTHAGSQRVWVRVPASLKHRSRGPFRDRPYPRRRGTGMNGAGLPPYDDPIVLVHGIGTSSRALRPLIVALGGRRPVFAPDLPGFGLSEAPAHVLDVPGLADALRKWMLANGVAPATLVGCSFGCQVAVDLAARHPELVERMVLVGPTIDPDGRSAARLAARWARNIPHASPRLASSVVHDFIDAGPWRTARTLRQALADPVEKKLSRVPVRTLVVHGEHDRLIPRSWAERLVELLPRGEIAELTRASHTAGPRAAAELAVLVQDFMTLEPRGPAANGTGAPIRNGGREATASRRWIVDGMNLIGSKANGWWRNRPRAWRRLRAQLEAHSRAGGEDVQLVLDGRRPGGWPEDVLVETAFAFGGRGAADDAIVARVAADPDPASLSVVTADRELSQRVQRLCARVVSPTEFSGRLRPQDEG